MPKGISQRSTKFHAGKMPEKRHFSYGFEIPHSGIMEDWYGKNG